MNPDLRWATPPRNNPPRVGFWGDHGAWGGNGVVYLRVRQKCFRLPERLERLPGLQYSAAPQAIQSLGKALQQDPDRARFACRSARTAPGWSEKLLNKTPLAQQGSPIPRIWKGDGR